MSEPPVGRAQVFDEATAAAQSAIRSEIESVVLERMTNAGGDLAQLARMRSFMNGLLGTVGQIKDIIAMAIAGYQAMTVERRMVMRVAAAHSFGYWAFKHTDIHNPLNPPNSFLIMHRERDRADAEVARETGNPNFSSDGGLTSSDWNIIWRRGNRAGLDVKVQLEGLLWPGMRMRRNWEERFPGADYTRMSRADIADQIRVLVMCPKLGNPTVAAGGFFLSSLKDATTDLEREMNLRLYRRFPYNPTVSR